MKMKPNMKNIDSINKALIKMNILDFRTMLGIGPSEVRAPAGGIAHAGGDVVASINTIIFSSIFLLSPSVTFLPQGVDLGL
jgi:hypothetical protein